MLLEIKNLNKDFGGVKVLKDINLTLEKGKIIGLLGSNGSGKTTLIKLINKLLSPSSGEILVAGNKLGVESAKVISYLPEVTYLDLSMSVKQTLIFFKDFYTDFNMEKAEKLLSELNINLNSKLKTLSKGTKEKVQLVLVLSRRADLYILDEPIGGVDPSARNTILKLIKDNLDNNATLLLSTHLIADIEKILDEVIFIKNGEIILKENTKTLKEEKNKSINEIFIDLY